ncbi:MAG: hypothetical protein E1N59_2264 [Puniceicoccaceae bacterium 5H]|nr:MAG: hypothetical protein E1N59_2264 [Puniceicoccaceae bacterium 5H]
MKYAFILFLSLFGAGSLAASVSFSFSFTLEENGNGDALGVAGSLWTLELTTLDDTYWAYNPPALPDTTLPAVYYDRIELTIAGGTLAGHYWLAPQDSELLYLGVFSTGSGVGDQPYVYAPFYADDAATALDPTALAGEGLTFQMPFLATATPMVEIGDSIAPGLLDQKFYERMPGTEDVDFLLDANDMSGRYAFVAVPEPTTYAGFGGLAALGFIAWRRRRA